MNKSLFATALITLLFFNRVIAQTWLTDGNLNINPSANFIGTKDRVPLLLRVNSQRSGIIAWQDTATAFGYMALSSNSGGRFNTAMGYHALKANISGKSNTAVGSNALFDNTIGESNSAFGAGALKENVDGRGNSAFGSGTLLHNYKGLGNSAFGAQALGTNGSGDNNVAVGNAALYEDGTGSNNTAIGFYAGYRNKGSNNVFIGYMAAGNEYQRSNTLYIANSDTIVPLIFGNFATQRVGLGTIVPQATLHVSGNVFIEDGTQGSGKVLTSDAAGLARWASPASGSVAVLSDVMLVDGGLDATAPLSTVSLATTQSQHVMLLGQVCFKRNTIIGGTVTVAVLRNGVKVASVSQHCKGNQPHTISINWVDKPQAEGNHNYELTWNNLANKNKLKSKSLIAIAGN